MGNQNSIGNWQAVLFDLDGTLIDSEWFYYKAWRKALETYGFMLDSEVWQRELAGKTDGQALEHLNSKYGFTVDKAAFYDRVRVLIAELHEVETVSLMPGAADLINFLHQRKIVMAVVTSSKREVANYHLERNKMRHFFSAVVTRTDVARPKPDPEPYLRCIALLGLEGKNCLVLEDSATGAAAAMAAGLTCFGVQTHLPLRQALPTDRSFDNLHAVREFLEFDTQDIPVL